MSVLDGRNDTPVIDAPRFLVALLVITVLTVQVALFSHFRVLGVMPDALLLLTILLALQGGPETGALVGLFAGIGFDLFVDTPLGLSALVYGLTGYFVGFARDRVMPNREGVSLTFVAAASIAGTFVFSIGAYLFDATPLLGPFRIVRIALVVGGWNVLLARPLGWLVALLNGRLR